MRVIFNIHSDYAATAAGWRAKEIRVNDKREATLEEALKAIPLADGTNMYDYIMENGTIKEDYMLYVNGMRVSCPSCPETIVKDNTQIHLDNRG